MYNRCLDLVTGGLERGLEWNGGMVYAIDIIDYVNGIGNRSREQ